MTFPVEIGKEKKVVQMTLVGQWQDLAYYYQGSDGNYWSKQSTFVCLGPKIRNTRGKTINGDSLESLPDLSE